MSADDTDDADAFLRTYLSLLEYVTRTTASLKTRIAENLETWDLSRGMGMDCDEYIETNRRLRGELDAFHLRFDPELQRLHDRCSASGALARRAAAHFVDVPVIFRGARAVVSVPRAAVKYTGAVDNFGQDLYLIDKRVLARAVAHAKAGPLFTLTVHPSERKLETPTVVQWTHMHPPHILDTVE